MTPGDPKVGKNVSRRDEDENPEIGVTRGSRGHYCSPGGLPAAAGAAVTVGLLTPFPPVTCGVAQFASVTESEPRAAVLWCDGACRRAAGQPEGPAAFGFVLKDDQGRTLADGKARIGIATSNVAEYEGVIAGLQVAADFGIRHLLVRLDSELVIKQMRGEYKVKKAHLKPLHQRALELCEPFDEVRFEHVRREQNRAADRLANQALDDD